MICCWISRLGFHIAAELPCLWRASASLQVEIGGKKPIRLVVKDIPGWLPLHLKGHILHQPNKWPKQQGSFYYHRKQCTTIREITQILAYIWLFFTSKLDNWQAPWKTKDFAVSPLLDHCAPWRLPVDFPTPWRPHRPTVRPPRPRRQPSAVGAGFPWDVYGVQPNPQPGEKGMLNKKTSS